jgi:hypothetical protein
MANSFLPADHVAGVGELKFSIELPTRLGVGAFSD